MIKQTWATYYHFSSTDDCYKHDHCPISECFHKTAQTLGLYILSDNLSVIYNFFFGISIFISYIIISIYSIYYNFNFISCIIIIDEIPAPHSTMELQISKEISLLIKKVYSILCKEDLLSKCLKNQSQNTSVVLHSTIWHRCKMVSY